MKVIKFGSINDIFQKKYNDFTLRCLNPNASIPRVKDTYLDVQDLFVRSGQVQDFFDKTLDLSKQLEGRGNTALSTLLVNELSKLCRAFVLRPNSENVFYKAINNFRQNHDSMHELARIIDLEQIYRMNGDRRNLFKVLHMKKNCCKRILANYEESVANFQSIHKMPTPRKNIQIQLGHVYSALGDMLAREKPDDAIAAYEKSIEINKKLGRHRAVDYAIYNIRDTLQGRHK